MVINANKCHAITFNFSEKNILPLNLNLDGNIIQNCDKIQLLGIIITHDLKWSENTEHICKKVNKKIYILGKLKKFGLMIEELLIVWKTILRPLIEYATPLWHSGLTEVDTQKLESLQKKVLGIILGVTYIENRRLYKVDDKALDYEETLEKLDLVPLSVRRENLTHKFTLQSEKKPRHNKWFQPKICNRGTRSKTRYQENFCKNKRTYVSTVPYMTRVLNKFSCVYEK